MEPAAWTQSAMQSQTSELKTGSQCAWDRCCDKKWLTSILYPLVSCGRVKLLENILQFLGSGLYWDRAVHKVSSPWLFTQPKLMGSRFHLDHYASPHFLPMKRFIPKMRNSSFEKWKFILAGMMIFFLFTHYQTARRFTFFYILRQKEAIML